MAWLKWRGTPERGKWYAVWKEHVGGKTRTRFRALSRDEETAEKLRKVIERNLALRGVGLGQVVPLARLQADYVKFLKADDCAATYISRVEIILGHLERLYPKVELPEITPDLLDDYKIKRRAEKIAGSTINREITAIKAALRKGRRWQYQINDLSDVGKVKVAEKNRSGYAPAEVRKLFREAGQTIWQLVLLLGLYAGLRRSEIMSLRWVDVSFEQDTLTLGDGWRTKRGRIRKLPLHQKIKTGLALLKARLARSGRPPAPEDRILDWATTPENLSARFARFVRTCGIGQGALHRMRHTFITALKRGDVDTAKTQRLVGHTSERTTQGYTHLEVEDLRAGMKRLKYE